MKKMLPAILLTGLLGALMYPAVFFGVHLPDLGFLGWFFLIPLLVLAPDLTVKQTFTASYAASFIFYSLSLYWMIPAMVNFGGLSTLPAVGVLLLVIVILSFYFSAAFTGAAFSSSWLKLPLFLTVPLFLTATDFIHAYFPVGGFPWPLPGYSQGNFLRYFQWVDVTGVWGLNVYVLLVNGLIAHALLAWKGKRGWINAVIALVIVVLVSFCGSILSQKNWQEGSQNYRVALLQGNISQDVKWSPVYARDIVDQYLQLTDQAKIDGADLAIWPETAYPYTLDSYELEGEPILSHPLPLPVLTGAVTRFAGLNGDSFYNSALFLNEKTGVLAFYHKRHLVPFGEYIPMKKWLTFAQPLTQAVGELSAGTEANLIPNGEMKIGMLICYEDIFPNLARTVTLNGANVLVNITNDAWYGNTSAEYQHLVFSRMRALENRRALLRATNTGVTAFIDPRGEIMDRLPPFQKGVLMENIQTSENKSIYTRWGDWVAWLSLAASVLLIVGSLIKRKKHVQRTA